MEASTNQENAPAKQTRRKKTATKIPKERKNHRKLEHIPKPYFNNTIRRFKVPKNPAPDAHPSPSVAAEGRLPDNGTQIVEVYPEDDDDIEAPDDDMHMLSVPRTARTGSFNSTASSEFSPIYSSTSSNGSYSPPPYPPTPHNLAMPREPNGPTPNHTQNPFFGNIQAISQPYYSNTGGPVRGGQPILDYTVPQSSSIPQGGYQNYERPHLPEQHHGHGVSNVNPTHAPFDSTAGLPYHFPSGLETGYGQHEPEFVPAYSAQSQYTHGMLIPNSEQNTNAGLIDSQNTFFAPMPAMQQPYHHAFPGSWPAGCFYTQASQWSEGNGPAT